jgi:hypothetical protein
VRLWIPEIDEHPVAHVLGHKAVEPGDRLGDALVTGADHKTHVLGVELGRESSRANEVGEHHSQLATLGVVLPSWLGRHGRGGRRSGKRSVAEIADRAEHFAAITEQNPEFLQVLIRKIRKNAEVNPIFDETLGVLRHAEPFLPVRNLFHRDRQRPTWPDRAVRPSHYRVYTDMSGIARVPNGNFCCLDPSLSPGGIPISVASRDSTERQVKINVRPQRGDSADSRSAYCSTCVER